MDTKRISLDFDEYDLAVLEKAKELLVPRIGQTSTAQAIRFLLREYVNAAAQEALKARGVKL